MQLPVPSVDAVTAAVGALTFADEFDAPAGTAVDRTRWGFDVGVYGADAHERQYYTDSTRNAVHDGAGHLVITARRENPAGYRCSYGPCAYTSARLVTQETFTQTYGRFAARMKLPRGKGMWPAFWLLGEDVLTAGWPQSGEIDVVENVGRQPTKAWASLHGPGYSGAEAPTKARTLDAPLADDFHSYRVDWEPRLIVWYLDGVEYFRATPATVRGHDWVFDHPFSLLVNLAVGGEWPGDPDSSTVFPQSLLVDWVRVWAYRTPTIPDFAPSLD